MRRTFALWLLLFGVYAATLGLDAFGASDYAGRRASSPAGRRVAGRGPRRRRPRRVRRRAAYDGLLPRRPRHGRAGDRRPAQRAARARLPAADRPGVPARRSRLGVELFLAAIAALVDRARLPAGAVRRARSVGARRPPRSPGSARPSSPTAPPSIPSRPPAPRSPAPRCWRSASTPRPGLASRPSAALRCWARCPGSAPKFVPGRHRDRRLLPRARCGARAGARSPSARSSCRCSAWRCSWG